MVTSKLVCDRFLRLCGKVAEELVRSPGYDTLHHYMPYLEIIGMGREVLPLIFSEIRRTSGSPNHAHCIRMWDLALRSITGDQSDSYSFMEKRRKWLEWADRNGYGVVKAEKPSDDTLREKVSESLKSSDERAPYPKDALKYGSSIVEVFMKHFQWDPAIRQWMRREEKVEDKPACKDSEVLLDQQMAKDLYQWVLKARERIVELETKKAAVREQIHNFVKEQSAGTPVDKTKGPFNGRFFRVMEYNNWMAECGRCDAGAYMWNGSDESWHEAFKWDVINMRWICHDYDLADEYLVRQRTKPEATAPQAEQATTKTLSVKTFICRYWRYNEKRILVACDREHPDAMEIVPGHAIVHNHAMVFMEAVKSKGKLYKPGDGVWIECDCNGVGKLNSPTKDSDTKPQEPKTDDRNAEADINNAAIINGSMFVIPSTWNGRLYWRICNSTTPGARRVNPESRLYLHEPGSAFSMCYKPGNDGGWEIDYSSGLKSQEPNNLYRKRRFVRCNMDGSLEWCEENDPSCIGEIMNDNKIRRVVQGQEANQAANAELAIKP